MLAVVQPVTVPKGAIAPAQLAASGSEDGHQAALFCWASLPDIRERFPETRLMFAIPNGGQRSKSTAGRLKATGVKAGVPDIFLPVPRGDFCGLFIELKRPGRAPDVLKELQKLPKRRKGVVSAVQRDWAKDLQDQGYQVLTCYGWEGARLCIEDYLCDGAHV